MPAAVPAVWEEAAGRRDLESGRSKRPAVCNTRPRRHCSLAASPGVLPDPLRWPLEPASCSTPPRPSCSLAVGVLRAAGAAGRSFCNTLPKPSCSLIGRQVGAEGARPGQGVPQGLVQGPARGLGAAGSSVSSRRPRQRWGLQRLQLYLGHEEQVVATGDRYCPSPGVGTGEEGGPPHAGEPQVAPD